MAAQFGVGLGDPDHHAGGRHRGQPARPGDHVGVVVGGIVDVVGPAQLLEPERVQAPAQHRPRSGGGGAGGGGPVPWVEGLGVEGRHRSRRIHLGEDHHLFRRHAATVVGGVGHHHLSLRADGPVHLGGGREDGRGDRSHGRHLRPEPVVGLPAVSQPDTGLGEPLPGDHPGAAGRPPAEVPGIVEAADPRCLPHDGPEDAEAPPDVAAEEVPEPAQPPCRAAVEPAHGPDPAGERQPGHLRRDLRQDVHVQVVGVYGRHRLTSGQRDPPAGGAMQGPGSHDAHSRLGVDRIGGRSRLGSELLAQPGYGIGTHGRVARHRDVELGRRVRLERGAHLAEADPRVAGE